MKAFLVERNHLWVALKNFPMWMIVLVPFYALWRYLLQCYAMLRHRGATGRFLENSSRIEGLLILFHAYNAALKGIPKMLEKRRQVQAKKRVSDREVWKWFKRYRISAKELAFKN